MINPDGNVWYPDAAMLDLNDADLPVATEPPTTYQAFVPFDASEIVSPAFKENVVGELVSGIEIWSLPARAMVCVDVEKLVMQIVAAPDGGATAAEGSVMVYGPANEMMGAP